VIIAGIIGARIFYVVGQWSEYQNNLWDIFAVQKGGLVFLGGFLFDLAVVIWFAKRKNIPLLRLLDILAPGSALGYAIGRVGCFLNGCCFGLPTSIPWAIKFPAGSLAHSYYPNQFLHPTQLYAILIMFLAFIALVYIYRRKKRDGQVFYYFFIFYGSYRLIVEFFRFSPIHWLGLTPSQWLALIFILLAGYGLSRNGK
ncbi:MAG: prolipoprotein diacylglyceryl transferase, partial [Candidatus Margulisbacteria bacterium]|nr:prolipoprotein diacylglyceryl transferase [Candidatus Margulisiibacteriota bacterium]